jgi:peptidoglycan/LPS O-acetylase OafA/YrhL
MCGMTEPEHWPWFVKLILFPPMLSGGVCGWLPLAKTPKWRAAQIGLIAYFFLFGIVFVWNQPIVAVLIVGVVALSLLAFLIIRWRNSIH